MAHLSPDPACTASRELPGSPPRPPASTAARHPAVAKATSSANTQPSGPTRLTASGDFPRTSPDVPFPVPRIRPSSSFTQVAPEERGVGPSRPGFQLRDLRRSRRPPVTSPRLPLQLFTLLSPSASTHPSPRPSPFLPNTQILPSWGLWTGCSFCPEIRPQTTVGLLHSCSAGNLSRTSPSKGLPSPP